MTPNLEGGGGPSTGGGMTHADCAGVAQTTLAVLTPVAQQLSQPPGWSPHFAPPHVPHVAGQQTPPGPERIPSWQKLTAAGAAAAAEGSTSLATSKTWLEGSGSG